MFRPLVLDQMLLFLHIALLFSIRRYAATSPAQAKRLLTPDLYCRGLMTEGNFESTFCYFYDFFLRV